MCFGWFGKKKKKKQYCLQGEEAECIEMED